MKKGWKYKKIKDVGEVIGGTTPSTTNPEFWGGDICWISPAELHGEHYLYDSIKKITAKAVSAKSLKELPVGTVILSSRAPIGKIAINKVSMYCNQGFKCVVCGPELYNEFLYWWLYGKVDYLNSLGTGATFKEISKTVVENIVVPIPPLDEQQRIVSRLDAAFAHIDELKANTEKQLNEARALFQKALTKAMEPKEGWEEKKLEDLCTDIVDCPHSTPRKVDHPTKYPCIRTSELKGGKIEWESMQYLDEDEYIVRTARIKPQPNDIVYGREGTYGDAALLPEGYCFSLGQRTMLFRPDVRYVAPKYLHYNVISSHVYKQAKAKNSGCGVGHVNVKDIKVFKIGVPSLSEQQRIVSRLDSLSAHVRELEEVTQKIIAECDALKQALLRQVFE